MNYKIALASNSPRRKELLSLGGWAFEVLPVEINEDPYPGEQPPAYVLRLAEGKARRAAPLAPKNSFVVAADTTVVESGEILGKPVNVQEATRMLRRLRGRTHQVYTAVAVVRAQDGKLSLDLCATEVPMRAYREAEIQAYVSSGDPLDKAGAYAIQHRGFHPVESLQGCYANVIGLPLCHLMRTLLRLGCVPPANLPQACQAALDYVCPVFQEVLEGSPQAYPEYRQAEAA